MNVDDRKEQQVERMLRKEGGELLSPGFRRKVIAQVASLPAPELIKPRRGWADIVYGVRLLTVFEKATLVLALLCAVLAFIPPVGEFLAAWSWELSDMAVSVTIGGEVVSASLLSVLSLAGGALFMVLAGAWGSKLSAAGS